MRSHHLISDTNCNTGWGILFPPAKIRYNWSSPGVVKHLLTNGYAIRPAIKGTTLLVLILITVTLSPSPSTALTTGCVKDCRWPLKNVKISTCLMSPLCLIVYYSCSYAPSCIETTRSAPVYTSQFHSHTSTRRWPFSTSTTTHLKAG